MSEQLGSYMRIEKEEGVPKSKAPRWCIRTHYGGLLGVVQWFARWRQYCFQPCGDLIFRQDWLEEIHQLVKRCNEEHRELTEEP